MGEAADIVARWTGRLRESLAEIFSVAPALAPFRDSGVVILHGSTTMGFDDACADLDLWWLLDDDVAGQVQRNAGEFFQFELDGRAGHVNPYPLSGFVGRLHRCDMDRICQLRQAQVLRDEKDLGSLLIRCAQQPMPPELSEALFFWHYVEMRGEHRACDNPIERGHATALLLSLSKAIAHALQAAIVLDRQPFPYDKWLFHAARGTPTGAVVAEHVERLLELLGQDALRLRLPEKQHPISLELRAIRQKLVDAAQARGINQPWLRDWWLYMGQAKQAFAAARWPLPPELLALVRP